MGDELIDRKTLAKEALRIAATIGRRGRVTEEMDPRSVRLLQRAGMLENDHLSMLGLSIVEITDKWEREPGNARVRTVELFLADVMVRVDDLTRIWKDE